MNIYMNIYLYIHMHIYMCMWQQLLKKEGHDLKENKGKEKKGEVQLHYY